MLAAGRPRITPGPPLALSSAHEANPVDAACAGRLRAGAARDISRSRLESRGAGGDHLQGHRSHDAPLGGVAGRGAAGHPDDEAGTRGETHLPGRPSDGRVKLAFIRLGQVSLEFLEPVGGETSWAEYLEKHGEGVQHLGFQVKDLERSLESLKRLGFGELHRGRYDGDNGTYVYMDTKDGLGVIIELLHSDPPRQPQ
jgi:hypothetical protein